MPDGRILSGKGRSPDAGRQRFSDDALKTMARLVGLKPLDQRLRPRLPKLDVDSLKAPPDTPPPWYQPGYWEMHRRSGAPIARSAGRTAVAEAQPATDCTDALDESQKRDPVAGALVLGHQISHPWSRQADCRFRRNPAARWGSCWDARQRRESHGLLRARASSRVTRTSPSCT